MGGPPQATWAGLAVSFLGFAVVQEYERGVVFRLGKVRPNVHRPGLRVMLPLIDRMRKVSLRTVTMPIQSQQIITPNESIKAILDATTERRGVAVEVVELKDIELPESMRRAMAREAEAEAEAEKRAKIIAAEGEALSVGRLAEAADVVADHQIALQLRNLQVLAEVAVEENSTIIFPAQFLESVRAVGQFVDSRQPFAAGPVDSERRSAP